ncbi:MAG: PorP/SprF family type IX secretion system membrane protein [Cyclobacteriaceae bacterium]
MIKKLIIGVFVVLLAAPGLQAQDPQFSQFYAAPLYLNPGFTGTTKQHRFISNYRNQWPAISKTYVTYSFSYDYFKPNVSSGFGILATTDKAGSASLRSTNIGLLYSYKVQLAEKWIVSPGAYFGYGVRDLDFNKLVFGDQLDITANRIFDDTVDPIRNSLNSTDFFEFGTGLVVYNQKFWAGFSAYHLNQPNQSLLDQESELPIKYSVHAGVRIPLYGGPLVKDKEASIAPSLIYKKQGTFDQLDFGLHFRYDPIVAGFWYRGIPLQQNVNDNVNHDAVVFMFGLRYSQFEIGYSFDMTVSGLTASTGGAHELSINYQFANADDGKHRKKRKEKFIPCPTFSTRE